MPALSVGAAGWALTADQVAHLDAASARTAAAPSRPCGSRVLIRGGWLQFGFTTVSRARNREIYANRPLCGGWRPPKLHSVQRGSRIRLRCLR
ncbi:hypothetical protein Aab01nite_62260 [Paractinoplanes abujensis]|nr:hypothetical protein Aab01nite_62260 [Actinoplanes abujensis]